MSKNKKVNNVSANVSNLGKNVMFAESIGDFARQFAGDVDRNGKEFSKLMSRFNPKNMYDVCVLGAILTNLVANVVVNAESYYPEIEDDMRKSYEESLKEYREIFKKMFPNK